MKPAIHETRGARRLSALVVVALAAVFAIGQTASAALPAALDGEPLPSLAPMLARTTPAVVNISTSTRISIQDHPLLSDPFFRRFFKVPEGYGERESLGSGVVVDARRGYVLTNNHVVGQADEIRVNLQDGRRLAGELVGADPETDIALIRVEADGLTAVPVGNSDELRVGDFVVAIGSPFGLNQTVTSGIVSALGRSGLGIEGYESFIQTDASINPGNSGGPLVNLRGELVGINTAILAPNGASVGIGFAIPANMARSVMDQLIRYGEVRRGRFGIQAQDLTLELAEALGLRPGKGAVVIDVEEDSAADRSGLRVGDVITSVNDRPVRSAAGLRNALGLLPVGSGVELEAMQAGHPVRLRGVIADPLEGYLSGERFHPELAGTQLGAIEDRSGLGHYDAVEVGAVEKGSAAWSLGLRPGDVILEVNDQRVADPEDVGRAVRAMGALRALKIRRGDRLLVLIRH
ncbi:MAG: DegQ family serine endoprotease [Chromatiales bacterium]|jgi:Do/DeqQ family serine protease